VLSTRPHISARKTSACNSGGICSTRTTNWAFHNKSKAVPPYLTSKGRSGRACCIPTTEAGLANRPHTGSGEANEPSAIVTLTRKLETVSNRLLVSHIDVIESFLSSTQEH